MEVFEPEGDLEVDAAGLVVDSVFAAELDSDVYWDSAYGSVAEHAPVCASVPYFVTLLVLDGDQIPDGEQVSELAFLPLVPKDLLLFDSRT